jgi:hypothetical protein
VIGPSLTSEAAYAAAGRLDDFEDFGNMHDYLSGYNPGTAGFGGGGSFGAYGSIPYFLAVARQASGVHPIVATETGYVTQATLAQGIPVVIAGRYVPRLFLEHFAAGIPRTFAYELADEITYANNREGHFGLLDANAQPKPGFLVLSSLIANLATSGRSRGVAALPLSLTSPASDVHHILFQKTGGQLALVVWRELPSYDLFHQNPITVQPAQATLTLGARFVGPIFITTFDDFGVPTVSRTSVRDGVLQIHVSDRITIVEY